MGIEAILSTSQTFNFSYEKSFSGVSSFNSLRDLRTEICQHSRMEENYTTKHGVTLQQQEKQYTINTKTSSISHIKLVVPHSSLDVLLIVRIICDIEYAFDEMYPPSPYHFSLYRYSYQKT